MFALLSANPYIPWDTNILLEGARNIRAYIGIAFNVGFWIFLGIGGIFCILKVIDDLLNK